ncbi:hypothetical protein M422DRAFT_178270 [Sphaerobolus stellatus SS14]|uniref:RFX-type winged-helix domain-containing protein n=1 Tax=Sphaerobolus stellatus (strain SS14) TaxID=990650 RepID=A0A0C9VIC7_SPHS4|nr:hypothetical protein M422DRAFT_178270 [Sphaerobolus stellatus SS14]
MGTYQKPVVFTGHYAAMPPAPQGPPRQIPDDYEKWYTEPIPNNRMLLSIRSGIPKEVNWALERMCRLSHNDQFVLRNILGLTDALIEWPEWYVEKGAEECSQSNLFSMSKTLATQRRHVLEAIFILRNASLNDVNAQFLATDRRTLHFLSKALKNVKADSDANTEFLLHVMDLLHSVVTYFQQASNEYLSTETLIRPLEELAESSNDRTIIITALRTLTHIISLPPNALRLTPNSPALVASVRYLPLLSDAPLITSCLDYMYAHFSHPPMVKAFLHNPSMSGTLKLLVSLLLREQQDGFTSVSLIPESIKSAPAVAITRRLVELSEEDLNRISMIPEPERSYEWMKALFAASDAEEVTQVDFWTLYRETFGMRPDEQQLHPLLSAGDVIKNVSHVFPTAQAMVLPGTPPRFVIKGITRKMVDVTEERFRCYWTRSTCQSYHFQSPKELWAHVVEHINNLSEENAACQWASCQFSSTNLATLIPHSSTHIPSPHPPVKPSSQLENVTLPTTSFPHPSPNPTTRPPPPPPNPEVVYPFASADPPSTSLTTLLIIRVLFRASFAATDSAPRADEDHFGFPGIVEEDSDEEIPDEDEDTKGQRTGRKAFTGVRKLLEDVRVKDTALMAWIGEILDVSIEEKPANV